MSSAIWLVLTACLSAQVPEAPPPDTTGATGPVWVRPLEPQPAPEAAAAPAPETPRSRFVFAFMPGITAGLSPLPSLELPFFFGGRLKARPWALGYQGTAAFGGADRYFLGFFLTHRHHITAQRHFGARGFVSVGGGVALLIVRPVIEAEGRVAVRFGPKRRGIFGGVARLGWNVAYGERAPAPQLGLFLGVSTL